MKNHSIVLVTLAISAISVFGFGLWLTSFASNNDRIIDRDQSVRDLSRAEVSQPPHASELTALERSLGFQSQTDTTRNVTLLVHPHSPCWLELPDASPASDEDFQRADSDFVGPESCAECHAEQYNGFVQTAHAQTSNKANSNTINGPFEANQAELATVHPDMSFRLIKAGNVHYQEVHFRNIQRKFPFDIVTGSGKSAQTYLFWEGDRLYQMHLSYFKPLASWINSPGYSDGTAWYTRETIPKCVQCHMTYMEWKPGTLNAYVRESTIYGVSCERCHGPARSHVEHHQDNPNDKTAKYIANPSKLEPARMNDVCSQCHLGTAKPLQAPFSFRPGDELLAHFELYPDEDGVGSVHTANQLQRMQLSRCYMESNGMTCVSCHDPHKNERGNKTLFSTRCVQCHQPEECGQQPELGVRISENCIDCHMGMGYDDKIRIESKESIHMPLLRDHFVRILPEATKLFLQQRTADASK